MRRLLYRWTDRWIAPPRWMCYCYYKAEINKALYVAFPLNYLVYFAWWLQDQWAKKANAPSWIEREVRARLIQMDEAISGRDYEKKG